MNLLIISVRKLIKTQFGVQIKKVVSDGGGEYVSNIFKDFMTRKGIISDIIPPYSPQLNGIAERLNRTLVEKARCLLKEYNIDPNFGGKQFFYSCFLKNRTPTKILKKSPFEI